jgi:CdiI immunity protein
MLGNPMAVTFLGYDLGDLVFAVLFVAVGLGLAFFTATSGYLRAKRIAAEREMAEEQDAARPGAGLVDRSLVQRLRSGPEFEALRGFFVGSFHEDWAHDFPDDDAVIRGFLETARVFPEDIEAVRAEMDVLLALGLSDREMDEALDVLGCCYKPLESPAVPWEANEWVRSVRERLA